LPPKQVNPSGHAKRVVQLLSRHCSSVLTLHCQAPVGQGPLGSLVVGEATIDGTPESVGISGLIELGVAASVKVTSVLGTGLSLVGLGLELGAAEGVWKTGAGATVPLPPTGPS
jgi:hypothetical protein